MSLFKRREKQWTRQPGEIAARIDADEVRRRWLNPPFVVRDGSVSPLFVDDRVEGRLQAARYDVDDPLGHWAHGDTATRIVMVDSGGRSLEMAVDGLESEDRVGLETKLTHLGERDALAELARLEASRSLSPDQLPVLPRNAVPPWHRHFWSATARKGEAWQSCTRRCSGNSRQSVRRAATAPIGSSGFSSECWPC